MEHNTWQKLKSRLLATGTVQLTGDDADPYITRSSAGPGAGGKGSVFFTLDGHRIRLGLSETSDTVIRHHGDGRAFLILDGEEISGSLERPALHCPRQAYITISASCIFSCRYCTVPFLNGPRKTPEEIEAMVESVYGDIDAISLTSGVMKSIAEEEAYTVGIVSRLTRFCLPIGVSIYPTRQSPVLLKEAGAAEVKFNIEAATPALFKEMCPGFPVDSIWDILRESVIIFGRGHVFSNVILGLGETDQELQECLDGLCRNGVIPVIRPLNPVAGLDSFRRPDADRIMRMFHFLEERLGTYHLDPCEALTMCPACTGCDMIPGRD
jgi:biotin synthase-related radical SAM superfamily protein